MTDAAQSTRPAGATTKSQTVSFQIGLAIVASIVGVVATRLVAVEPPPAPVFVAIAAPPDFTTDPASADVVISPDGRTLALVGIRGTGAPQLWLRRLASEELQALPGTAAARQPFWSPDGRRLGFFAGGTMRAIEIATGSIATLCEAPAPRGAAWGRDGIVFQPDSSGPLWSVPATGGRQSVATTLDIEAGETDHCWPSFLPDQRHFVFTTRARDGSPRAVGVGSMESRASRVLPANGSGPVYSSGYLLTERDGATFAQRFDPRSHRLSGEARAVPELRAALPGTSHHLSASRTGTVVQSASDRGAIAKLAIGWRGLIRR
jgi:hypothetical protein